MKDDTREGREGKPNYSGLRVRSLFDASVDIRVSARTGAMARVSGKPRLVLAIAQTLTLTLGLASFSP